MRSIAFATLALSLGSTAVASIATTCFDTDVCYGLNIPNTTATTGTGDIFFQISAPTSYSWVALGQGSDMVGSNIFVMYTSTSGTNVTISPRQATGYNQPQYVDSAKLTLLEGSGVSNGTMTANVLCSNCEKWDGGSMDFTGSTSDWIYAYKSGSSLGSDDLSETISKHDMAATFSWDLSEAKGGSDVNPFITQNTTTNGTSTTTSSASNGTSDSSETATTSKDRMANAHGALASLAFVALFPIGGMLVRLGNFLRLVWVHAALQFVGYFIYTVAFAMGVYLATSQHQITDVHPRIGIALFIVLLFQPILGFMHHRVFGKTAGRSMWSWAHISLGRATIVLGMVNGGLGLRLAGAGKSSKIAYGVIAGVMGVVYIAVIIFGELTRKKKSKTQVSDRQGIRLNQR